MFRALTAVQDSINGGFGAIKHPLSCVLRFLQHEAAAGNRSAHTALNHALDAMLASDLYDPLDGSFFRATLTADWRVFVPEKPLGVNALLALTLLENGRRSEAVRVLDFMLSTCALSGGALTPVISVSRESCAFTPEQVCAALGNEDGLRACRLLNLRRQHAPALPHVTPSRFSPVSDLPPETPPLTPTLPASLTPEDAAFLRRVTPKLLHARAARALPQAAPYVLSEDCALAAAVFALCGRRLGEVRYIQAAQRAVSFLIALPTAGNMPAVLPPSVSPTSALSAQATCGAAGALALALLTLGQDDAMANTSIAVCGRSVPRSMPLRPATACPCTPRRTRRRSSRVFPPSMTGNCLRPPRFCSMRSPLPTPCARRPGYLDASRVLWEAAAPFAREQPLACASLIDAGEYHAFKIFLSADASTVNSESSPSSTLSLSSFFSCWSSTMRSSIVPEAISEKTCTPFVCPMR